MELYDRAVNTTSALFGRPLRQILRCVIIYIVWIYPARKTKLNIYPLDELGRGCALGRYQRMRTGSTTSLLDGRLGVGH